MFATEQLRIDMRRDVFQAIADPTRRDIINLIAHQSMTPNHVADKFDVSRQAISKHMKILTECGILVLRTQGRERFYAVEPARLQEVEDWLTAFKKTWEQRFDRLDTLLNQLKNQNNDKKK